MVQDKLYPKIIYNANKVVEKQYNKRVPLVYRTLPFFLKPNSKKFKSHQEDKNEM